MPGRVGGVEIDQFTDAMRSTLLECERVTDDRLRFELGSAADLSTTAYGSLISALKKTPVYFDKQRVGELTVLCFKYRDGTGKNSLRYNAVRLRPADGYELGPEIVPQEKDAVHSEVFIPLMTHRMPSVGLLEPSVVSLDLLGLSDDGTTIQKIDTISCWPLPEDPVMTLTTGVYNGERFGDPSALYNSTPNTLIFGGSIALTSYVMADHPGILECLRPNLPAVAVS